MGKTLSLSKITGLAIISFLAISLITLSKNALELEDAEQAYYSHWFRLGYDDQPPLYTWLQYAFNKIFGVNRISFSILRGFLFAGTLMLLYRFSALRIKDEDKRKLAVLVLVLVPVYIDFTFRRLSHTSLLCFFIIGTYFCLQRLLNHQSLGNYLLFGVFVGMGLLSKYNYAFFLLSFGLVVVWDKKLRGIFWNPKILISILISLLLVGPHVYWLLGPEGFQSFLNDSVQEKIGNNEENYDFFIWPLAIYLKGVLALFILVILTFILGFFINQIKFNKLKHDWFYKMFLAQFIVLSLFFLVFQGHNVETRWLLPLFIPFTVLLFEFVSFKNNKKMVSVGFLLFVSVIFVQTIRTPIEKLLKIPSSVHFGFESLADTLKMKYDDYQWVLPNVTYAGNVRLIYPEKTIVSSDDYSLPMGVENKKKFISVSIIKSEGPNKILVDSLIGFGREKENLYFYVD
jgi:4-amino-4-deoxy-L-arabinose transferase-like glycosyltransferase